jgi:hypothetical protein
VIRVRPPKQLTRDKCMRVIDSADRAPPWTVRLVTYALTGKPVKGFVPQTLASFKWWSNKAPVFKYTGKRG